METSGPFAVDGALVDDDEFIEIDRGLMTEEDLLKDALERPVPILSTEATLAEVQGESLTRMVRYFAKITARGSMDHQVPIMIHYLHFWGMVLGLTGM